MTLRQQTHDYIDFLDDNNLAALQPLLAVLAAGEPLVIETDLTEEERAMIAEGMEEYRRNPGCAVKFKDLPRKGAATCHKKKNS